MTDEETDSMSSEDNGPEYPAVTKEWLEYVLKKYHSGEKAIVKDFSVRPGCFSVASALSDILAVDIEYQVADKDKEINVIVKRLPQDPFSRFFVTEAQFDLREIKFYTQVVPELENFQNKQINNPSQKIKMPIPKCIFASYTVPGESVESPEPPESHIVLENLSNLGFEGAKFSEGLTLKQAEAALDSVAKIHALSLSLKVKDGQSLSERYPFLFQTIKASDSYQQHVERGLPQLAHFLERTSGSETVLQSLSKLRNRTKEIIADLLAPEGPLSLITHTDFWCNNLLFRYPDENTCECVILDWQMVTYSKATNDIALLLVSSIPTELRRRHANSFLDRYWTSLTSTCSLLGLDIIKELGYTRADLEKDYKKSQMLALLLCIGSVDYALGDPLTEQRLIDVLEDLQKDGTLEESYIIGRRE